MVSRNLLDLSLSCVQSFLKVLVFIITSKVMHLLKYAALVFTILEANLQALCTRIPILTRCETPLFSVRPCANSRAITRDI